MRTAIGAGVALGVLYSLSPLTVLSLCGMAAAAWVVAREMSPRERAWFGGVLTLALGLRLLAIAALFLLADPRQPYASFFGDEELFKQQTVWLRNVFLGIPISPADMIYVFDEVGRSSYVYLLAYLQALVGDAPYGLNVLNACVYVAGTLIIYRLVRPSFGGLAALSGCALLLFLPSLFSWSISVLKESLYILLLAIELTLALHVARGSSRATRVAAVAAVVACAFALESVRIGGVLLVAVGAGVGVSASLLIGRPRAMTVAVLVAPVLLVVLAMQPAIRQRALRVVQDGAFQHTGHVITPGHSYQLVDPRLYAWGTRLGVYEMSVPETGRYMAKALASFVTVPTPSHAQSRAVLAYLPEHAVWLIVVVLVPIGAAIGFRRDPVLTCLLLSHGLAAAGMVALTGGNIGTLIRHRGLTLPYFAWLAALGAVHIVYRLTAHQPAARAALPIGEHA
jgi:hypothetical protein